MINVVEDFLAGSLPAASFSKKILEDVQLQEQINDLIPREALYNRKHQVWYKVPFETLKQNDFNCMRLIKRICRFDGSIGDNYNLFGVVRLLYAAQHPDIQCTDQYKKLSQCKIDIGGECFGGPETSRIIESIVKQIVDIKPKTERKKGGKALIRESFHVVDNKVPRWIQGAEWPMGTASPMQFIGSKKIKNDLDEGREYLFKDFETGELKRVVQYY